MALGYVGGYGAAAAQDALRLLKAEALKRQLLEEQRQQQEFENTVALRKLAEEEASGGVSRERLKSLTRIGESEEGRKASEFTETENIIKNLAPTARTRARLPQLGFMDVATPDEVRQRGQLEGESKAAGARAEFEGAGKGILEQTEGPQGIRTLGNLRQIAAQGANAARVARINQEGRMGGASFMPTVVPPASDPEAKAKVSRLTHARDVLMQAARSDQRAAQLAGSVNRLLSEGQLDEAEAAIRDFGIKQMPAAAQEKMQDYFAGSESAKVALDQLAAEKVTTGPYKNLMESAKPWLLLRQDPRYTDLRQAIELGQAPIRRGFFGTAVTGTEMQNARRFLINDNDPPETVRLKLRNTAAFLDFVQDVQVSAATGLPRPKLADYIKTAEKQKVSLEDLQRVR